MSILSGFTHKKRSAQKTELTPFPTSVVFPGAIQATFASLGEVEGSAYIEYLQVGQ
jgi:hypothetical protein